VIVVDASAAVLALLNDGDARAALSDGALVAPHLIDSEVLHALRSRVRRNELDAASAGLAVDAWGRLGIERIGVVGLLDRIWELLDNVSAYDATYIAVSEAVDAPLLTADARLAAAPGPRCPITVVRS